MPTFTHAIIIHIDAEDSVEAERAARHIAQGLGDMEESTCYVADYEHDNDGQRVIYLPADTEDDQEPDTSGEQYAEPLDFTNEHQVG